ncbi:MAG: hypothetical protein IJI49_01895 [Bacilli bacterium]|nr:hypothetical protein [Bacilli bacterium]
MKKEEKTSTTKKKNVKKDVVITEKIDSGRTKKGVYFSYGLRATIFVLLFTIFFSISMLLLVTSLSFQKEKYVSYSEKSSLDYKVNLKENNFYETRTLDKDMIYVASLIDSIDTYFDYDFDIDEKMDIDFTYNVIAKLKITDEEGSNTYLEKDYTLLNDKVVNMKDNNHIDITEKINIDYGYYNSIASGFKQTYGVNSKSNLIVSLKVNKNNTNALMTNKISTEVINIPLSERSINIKMDYIDINTNSSIITERDVTVNNTISIGASIILLIISIYFILKFIRLLEKNIVKQNKFDKYVKKVLRTYDRLIVESKTIIDFSNYEIIKVNKFEELLDVRDNLKLPINYYVVTPHQKAYFYIVSTNIYLYTVKEVDLENSR